MRVVLTDGTELPCTNFRAIDSGVLLTKDKKRKKVIGFVPHREVKYVVPDDVAAERAAEFGLDRGDRTDVAGPGDADGADGDDDERDSRDRATLQVTGPTGDATGDLRRLGGVGSTYADRLRTAGYGTLADLAAADPVAVAEAASVPPGRARRWIDAAVRRTTPGTDRPDEADEGRDGERADATEGKDEAEREDDSEGAEGEDEADDVDEAEDEAEREDDSERAEGEDEADDVDEAEGEE